MVHEIHLRLSPEQANDPVFIQKAAADQLRIPKNEIVHIKPLKRSIDARSRHVKIQLRAEVYQNEEPPKNRTNIREYPNVSNAKRVIVIGSGPAGLFAALRLIEAGIRPIVLERGKNVRDRRRDLANINKKHVVNNDSNYCFGEGGAGTYSDGKLYTRSTKRGDVRRILEILFQHGADPDIMVDAHPHIGTNKLPQIVTAIRESILKAGGEVHFETKVTDFIIKNSAIKGVITQKGEQVDGEAVILATGHSARDIFELLRHKGIQIEAKPFALGVRIEHPQSLIDSIQYKCDIRSPLLPPAAYNMAHQVHDRGVYSFCMCPGGIIAPCATAQEEIVTNGWSPSKRNNPWANSGMVVETRLNDFEPYKEQGPLAGMQLQKETEYKAWLAGGKTQVAPAQRMIDFINDKSSSTLPDTSYLPGITSVSLQEVLPKYVTKSLRVALQQFGKKMKGYLTNEAVLVATESRTSSPVRIPRDNETLEHPQIQGLYPCGEGAGFAGGIVSAAIDGERCAEKAAERISQKH